MLTASAMEHGWYRFAGCWKKMGSSTSVSGCWDCPSGGSGQCHKRRRRRIVFAAAAVCVTVLLACSTSSYVFVQRAIRSGFQQTANMLGGRGFCQHKSTVVSAGMREELFTELSPLTEEELAMKVFIFVTGLIPFVYAAWEFWRRIAFGEQFGTGRDRVVFSIPGTETKPANKNNPRKLGKDGKITIGMDADTNRGRRVLGTDALVFAVILMFVAFGSVVLAGWVALPALTTQGPTD